MQMNSTQKYNPKALGQSPYYERDIWDHEFVESLWTDNTEKICRRKIEKLKKDVKDALNDEETGSLDKLELIDAIERLGVGYHFEKETGKALDILCINQNNYRCLVEDLYFTALCFRILRQHGFEVSQDMFNAFKDDMGRFGVRQCEDMKGMLSLYEASHLCFEGENILSEAKAFTITHLKLLQSGNMDQSLAEEVNHALELPLHWRMSRLESRWYINVYQKNSNMNPSLVELAKLDFNLVQANHQKELNYLSRWWRNLGIARRLSFARDRLVESFFCAVGLTFEPRYECCREQITKVINFILTIDDIYDIYGSLDELELFTIVVIRWELEAMEQLPDYMKICFFSLYDTINEMAHTTLKEQGWDILPYLKKGWADFCKAMLIEAKWSNEGYTPNLQEYLANAWISSSAPAVLVHAFFATNQTITDEVLQCLEINPDLIHYSSMIFRLCNDLVTTSAEKERGDVASAIQCYMHETNVSEKVAHEHIEHLVSDMWKKLNKSIADSPFALSFVNIALNLVRTGHSIYQYGDGIGVQDSEAKERIMALLVKPI